MNLVAEAIAPSVTAPPVEAHQSSESASESTSRSAAILAQEFALILDDQTLNEKQRQACAWVENALQGGNETLPEEELTNLVLLLNIVTQLSVELNENLSGQLDQATLKNRYIDTAVAVFAELSGIQSAELHPQKDQS